MSTVSGMMGANIHIIYDDEWHKFHTCSTEGQNIIIPFFTGLSNIQSNLFGYILYVI